MAPRPAWTGRIARRLFSTCYRPDTLLLWSNYLPVTLLFRVRRRFLTNHLEENGFWLIFEAKIASEQGEQRDNRE
jgi:hypothetical protein